MELERTERFFGNLKRAIREFQIDSKEQLEQPVSEFACQLLAAKVATKIPAKASALVWVLAGKLADFAFTLEY